MAKISISDMIRQERPYPLVCFGQHARERKLAQMGTWRGTHGPWYWALGGEPFSEMATYLGSPAFHKFGELAMPLDALNRCIIERDHKGEQFRLYHSVAALSSKLWASALLQLLL